jgi:hypothetical protein
VKGFTLTNARKANLIDNLSIMLEENHISFPEIPALINELRLFTYEQLPSGLLRYGAPYSYHDDCVIALALAAWQQRRERKREIQAMRATVHYR